MEQWWREMGDGGNGKPGGRLRCGLNCRQPMSFFVVLESSGTRPHSTTSGPTVCAPNGDVVSVKKEGTEVGR